ncbi:MAG: hypothetical protein U0Y96_14550 [Candidatus Kapaibacterium sp.]
MPLNVKLTYLLLTITLLITMSCSDTSTTPNNNNNGFTPPTGLILKLDGINHSPSMDAVSCGMTGGNVTLAKPFGGEYVGLRVQFMTGKSSDYRDIASQVEEGKHKVFHISNNSYTSATDSVGIELDQVPYYFKAIGGRLYVSKSNGKLRYTTDGEITVKGPKYTGSGASGVYTKKLEFSIQCGDQ